METITYMDPLKPGLVMPEEGMQYIKSLRLVKTLIMYAIVQYVKFVSSNKSFYSLTQSELCATRMSDYRLCNCISVSDMTCSFIFLLIQKRKTK